ncbi:MAG: alpha/beta fold hydrolase [Betaproteobacteria bacterium]
MPFLTHQSDRVEYLQAGAGRDLVLLHSLLADRSVFDAALPQLSARRRVTLLSLPGYRGSTPAGSTVEDYADHVAAALAALELPRETDVLGNGFGGFIAVALAARHGERFDRLIAAPALAAFPEPGKQPLRLLAEKVAQEGMAAVLDAAIKRMFPEPFIAQRPEVVAERKRALAEADPACFRTACLALASLDLTPVLPAIRNRTLVLAGSQDATTPVALARELAAGIPGARFMELPGCGHCPQLEDPQKFVAALEAFLA